MVFPARIAIAKDSTSAFAGTNFPQDMTQIPSFPDFCNVYPRFIKGFNQKTETLNRWLRKDVRPTLQDLSDEKKSFWALKYSFIEPTVLELHLENRTFLLDTDSSTYQIGVVLI